MRSSRLFPLNTKGRFYVCWISSKPVFPVKELRVDEAKPEYFTSSTSLLLNGKFNLAQMAERLSTYILQSNLPRDISSGNILTETGCLADIHLLLEVAFPQVITRPERF